MDLTAQFLEDYREMQRRHDVLAEENKALRDRLGRLEAAASAEAKSVVADLTAERDRLKADNLRLLRDVTLWRMRHDDLARG